MVTIIEEILNEKLHFLCSVSLLIVEGKENTKDKYFYHFVLENTSERSINIELAPSVNINPTVKHLVLVR